MAQLAALRKGKFAGKLGKLPGQALGFECQALDALDEELGLTERGLSQLLAQAQVGARIVEKPPAPLFAGFLPGAIEGLDLRARELVAGDRPRHLLTGAAVDPGQRDERLHRCLSRDLALADRFLDRQGELPHQPQATTDPTGAALEAAGQLLLTPAEAMLKLGEQPPLLQGAGCRRLAHLPLQDQRLGLRHLPDHGVDRVVPQPTEDLDTQMAVDDDVAIRLLGVRHHHDGLLLTVLLQRHQQPTLALAATSAQLAVAHLQLVKLQLHDGSSAASKMPPRAIPRGQTKPDGDPPRRPVTKVCGPLHGPSAAGARGAIDRSTH